jgi:predicted dehydrogenase
VTVDRLRIGVVGTAHWAQVVHAPGVAAHPDVELVGVWGRDLAKADALAEPVQVRGYDDFDALLDEVDVLSFAVPPQVQATMALRAAEAGKHLLLEKPIATDLAAADRLVEAAERAGISTVVFFTQRFVPPWEDWLDQVVAQQPVGGRADWYSVQIGADSPYANSVWRREDGALWDVGPHQLAQLLPALGPVTDVTGTRGAGDLVHLVLAHENGATSRMSLSLTMPPGTARIDVEFYVDGGWLVQPEHTRDVADAYARALTDLVANVRAGETRHRCDVRFGRDVVEVLTRCEQALGAR